MAELKQLDTRILIRSDTAVNWETANPVLLKSEFGVEIGATPQDNKIKIGDGVTEWNNLAYTYNIEDIRTLVNAAKPTAENVFFNEDLIFTENFGRYTPDSTGSVVIPTATDSMSVADLFLSAFSTEKIPTVTQPAVSSFTASLSPTSDEVGTVYGFPAATAQVTTGLFEYGSEDDLHNKYTSAQGTGIVFSSIKVTNTETSKSVTSTNSNSPITLTLTTNEIPEGSRVLKDSTVTYRFTVEATYPTADRYPITNLGNLTDNTALNITSKTLNSSCSVSATGYRAWFMYIGSDCLSSVDSSFIRTNGQKKGNAKNASTQQNITIPAGTKRVLIALPTATSYNKRLRDVIDVDGMGLSVFGNFTTYTVSVAGANNYTSTNYIVYECVNTNGLAATRYTFSIS